MINNEVGAIVIGGHFHALGLIRSLAKKGVKSVLIDHEPCMARYSRYVWKYYRCPHFSESEKFIRFLIRLADQFKLKNYVLFPTCDETIFTISKNKDLLSAYFKVTTPAWDCVKYAYNKKLTYSIAENAGIPIPKTYYPASEKDLPHLKLNYPVVLKPAVVYRFFKRTKTKVFQINNEDDLFKYYRLACSIIPKEEIMLQEKIQDACNNLYSFCPWFKNKQVLAQVTAKRLRQHPMEFGQASTLAVSMRVPELETLGVELLRAINFYGICEIEFLLDSRDHKYKLLEINPRVWGWHTIASAAGVNLPWYLYSDMMGKEIRKQGFLEGVKWRRFITDTPTAITEIFRGRLTWKEYTHSVSHIHEHAVFSYNDPLPFFGEFFMLPYLWKKRGF
ncbi:hypothetical protein JW835_04660 [bacterium]|nr:hypothetical protein [bacterium]RQV97202.1 MAG: hypothetical protein EH221_03985 [bacterium]